MQGREWDILLSVNAKCLPVAINDICRALGIIALSYEGGEKLIRENGLSEYLENDAFTAKIQGRLLIFYKKGLALEEKRCAVMHEISHIVCGHTVTESSVFDGIATTWNKVSGRELDIVEEAAEAFSSAVLAPACVLWALKIHKASEIEKLCSITKRLARRRAARMEELYDREKHFLAERGRTCFLLSSRERMVYMNFENFIAERKPDKKKRLDIKRLLGDEHIGDKY